jgi:hypothetical protein
MTIKTQHSLPKPPQKREPEKYLNTKQVIINFMALSFITLQQL